MARQTYSQFLASIRSIYKSRKSPRISAEDHRIVFTNLVESMSEGRFIRIVPITQAAYEARRGADELDEDAAYFITGP